MAFNATIALALVYAPQLGTLTADTVPSAANAAVIWAQQFAMVKAGLRRASISATVTASTGAEAWMQRAEALLTSGWVLMAKGSIGRDAVSTAQRLIDAGNEMLATLLTEAGRLALVDLGATASNATASTMTGSRWEEAMDPNYDETPGTGNEGYAPVPAIEDGADL